MLFSSIFIAVITLLNVIVYYLRKIQEEEGYGERTSSSSPSPNQLCRRFSLAEIKSATRDFDESLVIGKGGFGKVYKGTIDNGASLVAIKRLDMGSKQGAPEFWTEIEMLSKFRHSHLVSLLGYCEARGEMLLVYEYMPGGTLADHLHKFRKSNGSISPLAWVQRLKICIGAARGLEYLHTGTGVQHRVIHRDVKSSNILLDDNLAAKISDFGLSRIGPANQECTTNVYTNHIQGTFGYMDADYFLTRRLTRKSDVYAFGVVLFEALCGRPAVDLNLEEDQQSLAQWAKHCSREGRIEQILDSSLMGEIDPNCLRQFVEIADKCLCHNPKDRPTMAEVVAILELALVSQMGMNSSLIDGETVNAAEGNEIYETTDSSIEEDVSSTSEGGGNSLTALVVVSSAGAVEHQEEQNGDIGSSDALSSTAYQRKRSKTTFISKVLSAFSTKVPVVSGISQTSSNTIRSSSGESSNASGGKLSGSSGSDGVPPSGQILPTPNLRVFSFAELKATTKNFRSNTVLGEGGFGKVYKGWLDEKSTPKNNLSGAVVAVKRLNSESFQGYEERQAAVNFLGRLSHPNLIKLLGYCFNEKELLLVYEFMQNGSLENHLFRRGSAAQTLPWDLRLKVSIGAARGLEFLHTLENNVIYRDFKPSHILLDGSYNAKISDFGLAKMGPSASQSHVTTRVMGTYGYAAPEYVMTGHLYVKSDVYGFGVVLVQMLTGLRAIDPNRPSAQQILVDWVKPYLADGRKLRSIMDSRLEGRYPSGVATQIAQLAVSCLGPEPKSRPSMKEVVETLEKLYAINERPKVPRVHSSTHHSDYRYGQQKPAMHHQPPLS